ncbi:MAG: hypothetical protein ACRDD1_08610 [Planctomycetia bacterium]
MIEGDRRLLETVAQGLSAAAERWKKGGRFQYVYVLAQTPTPDFDVASTKDGLDKSTPASRREGVLAWRGPDEWYNRYVEQDNFSKDDVRDVPWLEGVVSVLSNRREMASYMEKQKSLAVAPGGKLKGSNLFEGQKLLPWKSWLSFERDFLWKEMLDDDPTTNQMNIETIIVKDQSKTILVDARLAGGIVRFEAVFSKADGFLPIELGSYAGRAVEPDGIQTWNWERTTEGATVLRETKWKAKILKGGTHSEMLVVKDVKLGPPADAAIFDWRKWKVVPGTQVYDDIGKKAFQMGGPAKDAGPNFDRAVEEVKKKGFAVPKK